MNGGYVMVDCGGLNMLAGAAQTIAGLYAKCAAAYASGKPILAYNVNYGTGVPTTPIPVFGIIEDDVYVMTASILQVRVTSADSVTITGLVGNNSAKTATKSAAK